METHKFDRRFFETIDSETKAYWLGFFYADGYVYKSGKQISITLQASDADHLQKFANIFDAKLYPYSYVDKRTNNEYSTVRCVVSSVAICKDLAVKGIHNGKTKNGTDSVINSVPDSLFHHFVRGFFDGDGCICRNHLGEYSFTLVGTKVFLETLRNLLIEKVDLSEVSVLPRRSIWSLAWAGNYQLQKFKNWLYRDSCVYLERKRELFDSIQAGHKNKTSKHKNVNWCNTRQKWIVKKMVKGNLVWGGAYDTEDEAIYSSNMEDYNESLFSKKNK
jgi:hypothetical protein